MIPLIIIILLSTHRVTSELNLNCDYQSHSKCHWNLDKNFVIESLPGGKEEALVVELPSIRGPVNFTVTSPFVNNSLTASCQLVLDVKVEKFLGGSLKVILTHDKNEVEIRNIPFVTSKGWLKEVIPLNPRNDGTLKKPFQILIELVSDQLSFPSSSFVAFRSITFQNCFSGNEGSSRCYLKCHDNDDKCVSRDEICDLLPNCDSGEDESSTSCEHVLPLGAYCSFARHKSLSECGWKNVANNRSRGSAPAPEWDLKQVGDEVVAYAIFDSKSGLMDRAVMRTVETFNSIPRFHSLPHSQFFNTCSIAFSYRLTAPNSELVVEMITERRDKNGNPERHYIFRDFIKSNPGRSHWKRDRSFLPINVSSPYYLVIEATPGIRRKDSISVTNITLSKECFAINVSSSEVIAWPQESRGSNETNSGYGLEALILTLCLLVILAVIIFLFVILVGKFKGKLGIFEPIGQRGTSGSTSASQLMSQSSTDVQLSRLRSGNNPLTEYNPNYEFGGSTVTLQDLREIPREKLTLVRNLGHGAFGEVYQGYITNLPGEKVEQLPVAIKTLPEYSANNQAEMDFLVEALIMSKFEHRNIVRFIGVCFEKMPRFIVLELLPGGDLKAFLRNSRGTPKKPSQLVMGDLLVMALDVARGCQYLEDNHFIHRDIAARNCLLTSRTKSNHGKDAFSSGSTFQVTNYNDGFNSSGIVTKIADFGMARDIYRSDYYKKGGKAMLPVKWMPAECFLDGIFTSKTDVWSYGVLLWEVMSMGYMPYPGRGNQEVMQFVTGGGRLSSPNSNTPPPVYSLMQECWNSNPDLRPSFAAIVERLGACLVDRQILETPLPLFSRVSTEDTTLMRPPPGSTDYLVPTNPSPTYSLSSEKTELLSPDTCSTVTTNDETKLLELLDDAQSSGSGVHRPWKKTSIPSHSNKGPGSESGISSASAATMGDNVMSKGEDSTNRPTRYVNV